MEYKATFHPLATYHLFNRAIGDEKIFRTDENMRFFYQRLIEFTSRISDVISYCLLPNHFHLVVKILDDHQLEKRFAKLKGNKNWDKYSTHKFIMEQYSNFLNA